MVGIYLFSCIAIHKNFDIVYQDINGQRDIGGDAFDVDLTKYDFIIATPPCNYYSKINRKRDESEYALKTKDYLPRIIEILLKLGKPFIVENVLNESLIPHQFDYDCFVYKVANHTYWTNVQLPRIYDLPYIKTKKTEDNTLFRQGGFNVHLVVEYFLRVLHLTEYVLYSDPLKDILPFQSKCEKLNLFDFKDEEDI